MERMWPGFEEMLVPGFSEEGTNIQNGGFCHLWGRSPPDMTGAHYEIVRRCSKML